MLSRFSELAELKLKWHKPLLDASQWAFIGSRVPEDGVTSLSASVEESAKTR